MIANSATTAEQKLLWVRHFCGVSRTRSECGSHCLRSARLKVLCCSPTSQTDGDQAPVSFAVLQLELLPFLQTVGI